jgi:hypothetical protein
MVSLHKPSRHLSRFDRGRHDVARAPTRPQLVRRGRALEATAGRSDAFTSPACGASTKPRPRDSVKIRRGAARCSSCSPTCTERDAPASS